MMALMTGACFARTDYLLKTLNKPADKKGEEVHPPPPVERVARLTRSHLADAYLEPQAAAQWMSALGASPEVIIAQASCLTVRAGQDNSGCFTQFMSDAVHQPLWGVPRTPASINPNEPDITEVDAARFLANALSIAPSLVTLQQVLGRALTEQELREGIQQGAEGAAQYIHARRWHRTLRHPSTALVMSGGSANGAFTAGIVWRLLGILEQCRGKPAPEGCGDASIDMVAGTSTGTLVAALVDLFHTPGQERAARDLLVSNYTCSVESDLYCVNSTWIWNLADDARGLVRFDGIDKKIRAILTPAMMDNGTELVPVSVDYRSGDVFGISDQDPEDLSPNAAERTEGFLQALMASIVEPVMAEPVDWVPAQSGRTRGTFLDGGVRSGLPVLQAVQRGAERVLLISTAGLDPEPSPGSEHAFGILMRTIDLFVAQPRVGEVQQAELAAITRRFAEFNLCRERLIGKGAADVLRFCRRVGPGFEPPVEEALEAATNMWMGPARFDQVASSWRTAWIYRPEEKLETATGYSFSPAVMRPLFLQGVRTFHQRCEEMLRLFEIRGTLARSKCSEPIEAVLDETAQAFAPMNECMQNKPEQRKCP